MRNDTKYIKISLEWTDKVFRFVCNIILTVCQNMAALIVLLSEGFGSNSVFLVPKNQLVWLRLYRRLAI